MQMTAKEYLLQAYLLEERIDSKLEQVEALRSLATKSTAIIRSHPGSGGGNDSFMEDAIIKIVDMEREITAEMERMVDLKKEIAETISRVEDQALRTLLEMRYLCYRDWPEIKKALGYSNASIHRMHKQALEIVEKNLKDETE
jgi:DNA-directed RNA polymerase specialized sigma subunit